MVLNSFSFLTKYIIITLVVLFTGASAQATNLEKQINQIFESCKSDDKNLSKILNDLDQFGVKLYNKESKNLIKNELYESTLKGQVVTLLVPYMIVSTDSSASGLAKNCWSSYEEWRRSISTSKPRGEDEFFSNWRTCVRLIYDEVPSLFSKIEDCR